MNEPITIKEEVRGTINLWKLHLRVWDDMLEMCNAMPEAQRVLNASHRTLRTCIKDMELILQSHEVSK